MFDVLIVGAGPAGSFAAERLAQGGARVALFDGRPEGEPKACGGGVTAKALKPGHICWTPSVALSIELEMYSPSGKRLHLKLEEPFAIYSRIAFDSYLRDRAREAGAKSSSKRSPREELREPKTVGHCAVRVAGLAVEWSGKMLVGADGANSAIAKKLAGPLQASDMEVAFGYRAPLPEQGDAPTVVAFLPGWVGYAWAFPRPDHISFGIATTQEAFEHKALDDLLWQFMIGYYRQREDGKAQTSGRTREKPARRRYRNRTCERRPNVTPRAFPVSPIKPGTSDARVAKVGPCWVMPLALPIQ